MPHQRPPLHRAMTSPALRTALRTHGFTESVIREMTRVAREHDAINLAQGFPDFAAPELLKEAAVEAIRADVNQYAITWGAPRLREALVRKYRDLYGMEVEPDREITVTCGATEAMAAVMLALVDPGDEVILIEPYYDLYPALIARAGAIAVPVGLQRPGFELDREALEKAFGPRTRAIMINNPQNPCGKVFSLEELSFIGDLCEANDALAIGDEVYEHLVYDGARHVSLLQVPGLAERSITISSTAKTFSMTGWKVGWTVAAPRLSQAVRMAHQILVFSTPGPLQLGMAAGLRLGDDYYEGLLRDYTAKRRTLCEALETIGFEVLWPQGAYYANVDISGLPFEDDLAFCQHLTKEIGVAAIPNSFFSHERHDYRDLVRFCFCKRDQTLQTAIERLGRFEA
jgi:aspartate/methionine/tyrosine aminotransferase